MLQFLQGSLGEESVEETFVSQRPPPQLWSVAAKREASVESVRVQKIRERSGRFLELQEGAGELPEFPMHTERQGMIAFRRLTDPFVTRRSPKPLASLRFQGSIAGAFRQIEGKLKVK